MKIKVISISWNEEIIAPYFLRHYSSFADSITIFDNQSTDNTCEILKECDIRPFDTYNSFNDDEHRNIKNNAWKECRGQYDWVIICDMDELIYSQDIRKHLQELKDKKATIIAPNGYNMIGEKIPTTKGMIYDEIPNGALDTNYSKVSIINPNEIEETNFNWGSHLAQPQGNVIMGTTNTINSLGREENSIKLLHYKWLSLEYVLTRYKTYKARLSQFNKIKNLGEHYSYSEERITQEYQNIKLNSKNIIK